MAFEPEPPVEPHWQPNEINIGRRRALVGLSGIVVFAMGVERAWAQGRQSCVLTPEAGEGPFYLDPKLAACTVFMHDGGIVKQGGVGGISPEAAVGKQYLRGTQFTDVQGSVQFRTIFPSWYGGRTPHVHFKVFLANKEGLTGHAASVALRANDNGPAARPKPKPDKVPAAAASTKVAATAKK